MNDAMGATNCCAILGIYALWVLFADSREKTGGFAAYPLGHKWRTVPAMGSGDAYPDCQGSYSETGQRRPGVLNRPENIGDWVV
jgi:hypothetical protein